MIQRARSRELISVRRTLESEKVDENVNDLELRDNRAVRWVELDE